MKNEIIEAIKKEWIESFGSFNDDNERNGYFIIGFIANVLDKLEINKTKDMAQFLIKFKVCDQIGPDDFIVSSIERLFDDNTKLSDIKEWIIKNGGYKIKEGNKRMIEVSLSQPETF